MASFVFHHTRFPLSSFSHSKRSHTLHSFKFYSPFHPPRNSNLKLQSIKPQTDQLVANHDTSEENSRRNGYREEVPVVRKVVLRDRYSKVGINSGRGTQAVSGASSIGKKSGRIRDNTRNLKGNKEDFDDRNDNVDETKKIGKKSEIYEAGFTFKIGLDLCSKRGDVMNAINLYDLAKKEGLKLVQYHYTVLLYLCSSAATGMVQSAKSGSSSSSSSGEDNSAVSSQSLIGLCEMAKMSKLSDEKGKIVISDSEDSRNVLTSTIENFPQTLDALFESMKNCEGGYKIEVSEDVRRIAVRKGFEMFNEMCVNGVQMNEATLTSVARMAMALGDGDLAFDMVKRMDEHGINPRLRSYGPALAIFCSNGDVEKAFMVEKHMLEHGVYPEEAELEALLSVCVENGKSDKVYYLLHKLRTSVRQVSEKTADLIETWFKSRLAAKVGKRKWDQEMINEAMENGGGGWHGKGWLGVGKWIVCSATVGSDGLCSSCGAKLVTIDLDPVETENFAKSVAAIAAQREKDSSFQKFQKWLEYYGPFEAVVDAANIGLYSQRKFKPSKVNAVVNGIRQMIPSRKWPLIVVHNRRIAGEKMNEPFNKAIIDKWRNADALYPTPTGSNDDWYWLYASIKCKSLVVTNDEMRDHLFQLLGNDFFSKWKERHQVRFSFSESGPVFRMPPPCSLVIQESEKGNWHIPVASRNENEDERKWLCCRRSNSSLGQIEAQVKSKTRTEGSVLEGSILVQLEDAERVGGCMVDFQI